MFKKIADRYSRFSKNFKMTPEERYLSKSTDLIDLENRQRQLIYGRKRDGVSFFHH
jgi:hypothetical protein